MCVLPDTVPSKTPDDDVDVPVDKKDDTILIGTKEIGHILDNKGMCSGKQVFSMVQMYNFKSNTAKRFVYIL